MELLAEFVRLVLDESVLDDNITTIKAARRGAPVTAPGLDLDRLKDIPQLSRHRIVRALGRGTEGYAFLLDDGSVIKLYGTSFGAKARPEHPTSIHDMPTYDVGPDFESKPYIQTWIDWLGELADTAGPDITREVIRLGQAIDKRARNMTPGLSVAVIRQRLLVGLSPSSEWLGSIAQSLASAFAHQLQQGAGDLHLGNIGIIAGRGGNPKFAFFDT